MKMKFNYEGCVKGAFLLLGLLMFSSCPDNIEESMPSVMHSVRYHENEGTGEPPPAEAHLPGEKFLAARNPGLSKEGYHFSGWNTSPDASGTSYISGLIVTMGDSDLTLYAQWRKERTVLFWTQSLESGEWYQITAVNLAEGAHCIVYADQRKQISRTLAQGIVTEYEEKIYPPLERVFGPPPDVDGNGKVILFLLDILDGYTPAQGGYVAGYFSPLHMMKDSVSAYSNEADMLFLDIYPGDPEGAGRDGFFATIAHELQHLIDFGKTTSRKITRDLWINEGLSLSAEYLYGGQRNDRIGLYNYAGDWNLSIPYGNNFFVWNGFWEQEIGDSLSNYATGYLFFQWLRLQAQGTGIGGSDGTGIYTAISDTGFGDYRAVTAAAAEFNAAFAGWPALLGSWMLANWYNSPQGIFGYRGEIDLMKYVISPAQSGQLYLLDPGEGVFSPRGSASYSPLGHIRYSGISTEAASGAPEDQTAGSLFQGASQTGPYLLTFNGNTDKDGPSEAGHLGSVSAEGLQSLRPSGSAPPPSPGPYPIGLADKLAGHGGTRRPVSFEEARTRGGKR